MDLNQAELGEKEKLAPARKAFPDADPPRDSFARRGKKEDASRSPSRARRLMAGVEGSFKRLSGVGMPPSADRSTTPKIVKRRNSIPGTVSTSSESGEGNGSAGDGTAASQEASFKQEAQDEFRIVRTTRRAGGRGGGGGGGSGSGGRRRRRRDAAVVLRLSDVPGGGRKSSTNKLVEEYSPRDGGGSGSRSGGGARPGNPDAAKPPTTATTPPRAREEAAAEALRSLMAEQQLSQTDLLRGLALL